MEAVSSEGEGRDGKIARRAVGEDLDMYTFQHWGDFPPGCCRKFPLGQEKFWSCRDGGTQREVLVDYNKRHRLVTGWLTDVGVKFGIPCAAESADEQQHNENTPSLARGYQAHHLIAVECQVHLRADNNAAGAVGLQ